MYKWQLELTVTWDIATSSARIFSLWGIGRLILQSLELQDEKDKFPNYVVEIDATRSGFYSLVSGPMHSLTEDTEPFKVFF